MGNRLLNEFKKNLVPFLVVLWVPINIFVAFFFNGENLLSLYVIYSMLIIVAFCLSGKQLTKIKIDTLIIGLSLCVVFVLQIVLELSTIMTLITFVTCNVLWVFFSDTTFQTAFKSFLFNKKSFFYFVEFAFLIGLFLSVWYGDGIDYGGWGTTTLKGPYEINHLLAYELLALLIWGLLYWTKYEKTFDLFFSFVFLGFIVLTGVRSALLIAVLAFLFVFNAKNIRKKIIFGVFAILIFVYLFLETDLFLGLIEKTQLAMDLGSISNGRGKIFKNSLEALTENNFLLNFFVGIGEENLLLYNRKVIKMAIHAHNDFIDALVEYGIFGLITYIVSFRKITRDRAIVFVIIFLLSFLNGFYMYQSIVIMTPVLIVFSDVIKDVTIQKNIYTGRSKRYSLKF